MPRFFPSDTTCRTPTAEALRPRDNRSSMRRDGLTFRHRRHDGCFFHCHGSMQSREQRGSNRARALSAWQRAGFLSPVVNQEQPHDTASWIVPIQRRSDRLLHAICRVFAITGDAATSLQAGSVTLLSCYWTISSSDIVLPCERYRFTFIEAIISYQIGYGIASDSIHLAAVRTSTPEERD